MGGTLGSFLLRVAWGKAKGYARQALRPASGPGERRLGRVQRAEPSQPGGAWPASCWNSENLQRRSGPMDLLC